MAFLKAKKHLVMSESLLKNQEERHTDKYQQQPWGCAERGLLTLRQACSLEDPGSAMCVQNFNDSRGLAIRITYRISLRSSSLWEPRHPLLKVVDGYCHDLKTHSSLATRARDPCIIRFQVDQDPIPSGSKWSCNLVKS